MLTAIDSSYIPLYCVCTCIVCVHVLCVHEQYCVITQADSYRQELKPLVVSARSVLRRMKKSDKVTSLLLL